MRIAIAQFVTETNTFSLVPTGLAEFKQGGLYVGDAITEEMRGIGEIGGFLSAADQRGSEVELIPVVRAWAMPGGRVTAEMLRIVEDLLLDGLRTNGHLDGVLLSMHGAAAADGVADTEGHLLAAVRSVIGNDLPLVVSLDHHANITQAMVDSVDALVGYQTAPHDPFETGVRTADLLFRTVERKVRPAIGWRKIPMVAPTDLGRTTEAPMKEWYELARDIERRPGVLSASQFPAHPYLDVPDVSWSAVVVTDGDQALADRLADELAAKAWEKRADFWKVQRLPAGEAVRRAAAADEGPILILDLSDSVLSGAPGDGTYLLQAMLQQGITCTALMTIVDPLVVDEAINAGLGAVVSCAIGGKQDPLFGVSARVTGKVSGIAEEGMRPAVGPFAFANMGRSVLLEAGSIKLVVSEFRGNGGTTPDIYRRFGIEPAEAKIIVAKTYFYDEALRPIVKGTLSADSPGLSGWDLRRFPWVYATRPLYPLDANVEWRAYSIPTPA